MKTSLVIIDGATVLHQIIKDNPEIFRGGRSIV